MTTTSHSLKIVYEGWESHQQALMRAVTPLMSEHLAWRLLQCIPLIRTSILIDFEETETLPRRWKG